MRSEFINPPQLLDTSSACNSIATVTFPFLDLPNPKDGEGDVFIGVCLLTGGTPGSVLGLVQRVPQT